jgi:hypothetical protein
METSGILAKEENVQRKQRRIESAEFNKTKNKVFQKQAFSSL